MPVERWLDLTALALLVTANSTPVLLSMVLGRRWAQPIDGGLKLPDGRPLLGSHKTWRGLIGGTAAAGIVGAVLSVGFAAGAAFGLLALLGDLVSSFIKRRMGRASGRDTPFLDQLPEALLPMIVLHDRLDLTLHAIAGTAVVFMVLDLLATGLLGSRKAPSEPDPRETDR